MRNFLVLFWRKRIWKMQENENLKGITVNGEPLISYIEKVYNDKITKEVIKIVRESGGKTELYHYRRPKYKPHEERNGPVNTVNNIEIHKRNRESYIKQAMATNDIKSAIVAVLISAEKPLTAFDIKSAINVPIASDPVKSAQIRVYIGYIMKSELSEDIQKNFTEGRSRGAQYWLSENAKMRHSFTSACQAAQVQIKDNTESVKPRLQRSKHKSEPKIDFILTDKNELPVLQVEVTGKIDININFNWGSK